MRAEQAFFPLGIRMGLEETAATASWDCGAANGDDGNGEARGHCVLMA